MAFRKGQRLKVSSNLLGGLVILLVTAGVDSARHSSVAENGVASVYSTESGGSTASGQKLNPGALTGAHRSLPFGSKARVTNKKNGRSVAVTIYDRGPFVPGRV